jgi:hypothetical protein
MQIIHHELLENVTGGATALDAYCRHPIIYGALAGHLLHHGVIGAAGSYVACKELRRPAPRSAPQTQPR